PRRVAPAARRRSAPPGRAISPPAELDDVTGELADPGLLLARQVAELGLDEVDPAGRDGPDVGVAEAGDRGDPAGVDSFDRPLAPRAAHARPRWGAAGAPGAGREPGPRARA